jgi:hypothetical protein
MTAEAIDDDFRILEPKRLPFRSIQNDRIVSSDEAPAWAKDDTPSTLVQRRKGCARPI